MHKLLLEVNDIFDHNSENTDNNDDNTNNNNDIVENEQNSPRKKVQKKTT